MSILTLVRHGQASFLQEDYDKLSALGEVQAQKLGEYWARQGVRFDRVLLGPRNRQIRTGALVGEIYQRAGVPWPEPEVWNAFDEYQAEEVVKRYLPALSDKYDHIRSLDQRFRQAEDLHQAGRAFEKLLQAITGLWILGDCESAEVESWPAFCARVQKAVAQIQADDRKARRIVVFTSGGPTAVTVQMALDLSAPKTLELSWMTRNGAYSEFWFSGDRFSLSAFNAFPHLDEPSLLTYR